MQHSTLNTSISQHFSVLTSNNFKSTKHLNMKGSLLGLVLMSSLVAVFVKAASIPSSAVSVQVHTSKTHEYKVKLSGGGVNHDRDLHLTKVPAPSSRVLSDQLQVLTIHSPLEDPQIWSPSEHELTRSQSLYHDSRSNAVFHVHEDVESGEVRLNGFVEGLAISHNGAEHVVTNQEFEAQKMDFIDIDGGGWNRTASVHVQGQQRISAVVELVIVCDKEFGDVFSHNRQRVLDYWTVYMWDINNRYQTLTSDAISFRVNAIVVIANIAGQPFIEEARGSDGRAEFGRILNPYAQWVYRQMGSWPAFDLAPLVTNTALEWGGGLAYMRGACRINSNFFVGTSVWNDGGSWGSLTVGAHELGHNLGAPHDDDPTYPGGCSDRGYIMAGATNELRWYFSSCSDRTISTYIRSSDGRCLTELGGNPILDPGYASPAAPDMLEQCRRHVGASASVEANSNCLTMRCRYQAADGGWWIRIVPPVDNTICPGGRCFRGACRPVSG